MPNPEKVVTTRSGRVIRPVQRYTPELFNQTKHLNKIKKDPFDPRDDWHVTGIGYWSENEE